MRVIVVGAGVMGLGTALALVRAGHRVTVLEQGPIPNPMGSSVDQHRVIRWAYGAAQGYSEMIADAFPAWDRLWAELGERHYVETGYLCLGAADDPWISASRTSLAAQGVEFAELSHGELARRFPMFDPDRVPAAFFAPKGGALLAARIVAALARRLGELGADLRPHHRVVDIEPEHARVRLADGTRLEADRLLVAAGVWVTRLLPALARRLTPSRQAVLYLEPPAALAAAWDRASVFSDIHGGGTEIAYGLPPVAGLGLKIGDHRFSLEGDPMADRTATEAEIRTILALSGRRLKGLDRYRLLEARTCFYTATPDESFLVERFGEAFVLSPCSGHGFKFAALIGERMAGLIQGEDDLAPFRRWLAGGVLQADAALL